MNALYIPLDKIGIIDLLAGTVVELVDRQFSQSLCTYEPKATAKPSLSDNDITTCEQLNQGIGTQFYKVSNDAVQATHPRNLALNVSGVALHCMSVSVFVPVDCGIGHWLECAMKSQGTSMCSFECLRTYSQHVYIGFNNQKLNSKVCEIQMR